MSRALYDIWEDPTPFNPEFPWSVQFFGFVAGFRSRKEAKSFVAAVQRTRKEQGFK